MCDSKKRFRSAGLAILVALASPWMPATARAEEVTPGQATPDKTVGWSVTLKATVPAHRGGQEHQPRPQATGDVDDSTEPTDWQAWSDGKMNDNDRDLRLSAEQACLLSMTGVVITYNAPPTSPPPAPVISAASQTWQWQPWCWSNSSTPVLPPPQGGTISSVPEPASLISALIGAGITGLGLWRRQSRHLQQK